MEEDHENYDLASDQEVEMIVEEYNRKRLIENMSGPSISMIIHIVLLTLMFVIIVKKVVEETKSVEVSITPVELKKLKDLFVSH